MGLTMIQDEMRAYWSVTAEPWRDGKRPTLRVFVEETEPSVQNATRTSLGFMNDNPEWQAAWDEVRHTHYYHIWTH